MRWHFPAPRIPHPAFYTCHNAMRIRGSGVFHRIQRQRRQHATDDVGMSKHRLSPYYAQCDFRFDLFFIVLVFQLFFVLVSF